MFRRNFLDEGLVGLVRLFVIRVACHADVQIGARFTHECIQIASVEKELFKASFALQFTIDQRAIQRFEIRPVGGIGVCGHECA